jgi:hypothetical protein
VILRNNLHGSEETLENLPAVKRKKVKNRKMKIRRRKAAVEGTTRTGSRT